MRDRPATADAPVVAALRAAGADVFARHVPAGVRRRRAHPDVPEAMNPLRPRPDGRRVQRRVGGAGRRRRLRGRAGHGHRRLDPDPGALLRHRRVQAELRRAAARRRRGARADARPRGGARRATSRITTEVFSALTGAVPDDRGRRAAADRCPPRAARTRRGRAGGRDRGARRDRTLRAAGCSIIEVDGSASTSSRRRSPTSCCSRPGRCTASGRRPIPDHYGPETLRLLRSGAERERGRLPRGPGRAGAAAARRGRGLRRDRRAARLPPHPSSRRSPRLRSTPRRARPRGCSPASTTSPERRRWCCPAAGARTACRSGSSCRPRSAPTWRCSPRPGTWSRRSRVEARTPAVH